MLGTEPLAGAAEPGNDLVEYQKRSVVVAESAQPFQVAVGRQVDPACTLDGFGDHRGDAVAPVGEQGGCRLQVVVGDLFEVGYQVAPPLPVGGDPLGAGAPEVGAVVAVGAPHYHLPFGVAGQLVELADHLQDGVDGLGTRAAEEHPSVRVGGPFDDHGSRLGRRFVGEWVEDVVGLETSHLLGHRVDDLGPSVPHLAIPEAGQPVHVLVTGVVPEQRSLTPDDVHEVGFSLGRGREGVQQRVVGIGHSNILLIGSEGTPGRTGWRSGGRVSTHPTTRSTAMVTAVTAQATVSPEVS